jgi:16S rRNA (cytosine967-C5)-methyltransferase
MDGEKPKSARILAADVLNQLDLKRSYVGPILDKLLPQTNEKQRSTDLVFGTIRNSGAIDTVIAEFGGCPIERISSELLNIIRIGAYELSYCPATDEYAIVNEAVESARVKGAGKKQTGFVNAVLRQITRHIKNRQISLSQADVRRTLPQTTLTGCEFDRVFLPDPAASPADYFSSAFSLPKWLVDDWLKDFGTEKTRQICFASNRKAGIYLRPNSLKITTQQLSEKFRQAGIDFEISADKSMLKIKSPGQITGIIGFAEGLFSVQDITTSQVVRLLKPQPGWAILDLCAAPGGKTAQLAELTDDKAKIVATDIDNLRLEKVRENVKRLGLKSVTVVTYENLQKVTEQMGNFDCVLLDVPCSNTGVLAKRPEVRYRVRPKTITELTKMQLQLLAKAAAIIKSKGKICYSTCSIQNSENNRLVNEFLTANSNFVLEFEKFTLPSAGQFDCDGGYVAVIIKAVMPR